MKVCCSGLEDVNGVNGASNTNRFSFVDSSLTDRSFFEVPEVFPWGSGQPDNDGNNEDAVE